VKRIREAAKATNRVLTETEVLEIVHAPGA